MRQPPSQIDRRPTRLTIQSNGICLVEVLFSKWVKDISNHLNIFGSLRDVDKCFDIILEECFTNLPIKIVQEIKPIAIIPPYKCSSCSRSLAATMPLKLSDIKLLQILISNFSSRCFKFSLIIQTTFRVVIFLWSTFKRYMKNGNRVCKITIDFHLARLSVVPKKPIVQPLSSLVVFKVFQECLCRRHSRVDQTSRR